MIACPEDLDPKNVCVQDKQLVTEQGIKWEQGDRDIKPHFMYEHRRTPVSRLITKLGLRQFTNKGPLRPEPVQTNHVRIPLQQHIGAPCKSIVKKGQTVKVGDVIAIPPKNALGTYIHASISGKVTSVNHQIEIKG
jgi:hypothetical protein